MTVNMNPEVRLEKTELNKEAILPQWRSATAGGTKGV